MRQSGNWNNQKRKKQRKAAEVVPEDSGRWLGNLANEGQIAVRQMRIPVPPSVERIKGEPFACQPIPIPWTSELWRTYGNC